MITPQLQSSLKQIGFPGAPARLSGRVTLDSRQVEPGDIFVAVRGTSVDGHRYIDQARKRGAGLIVGEDLIKSGPDTIEVRDSARILGLLAHAASGQPDEKLFTMGVTGTNGKTTVAYLIRHILNISQKGCGMVGTIEYDLGGEKLKANNTTPDPVRLAGMMAQMVRNGLTAMVMECSSHGLHQQRTSGMHFNAAAFTNLSGDHLDYHGTMADYLAAKSILFNQLDTGATAVINREDPAGAEMIKNTQANILWYGLNDDADLYAHQIEETLDGSRFLMSLSGQTIPVQSPLIGTHNIYNVLTATGMALAAGCELDAIAQGVSGFAGVPGRLERITDPEGGRTILVDYAHTDDALDHALSTLARFQPRHMTVVFGCGGERDRTKRPRMAAVAEKWANAIIVTNDNPRREDPDQIFNDIRQGFTPDRRRIIEIADRREAIEAALAVTPREGVLLVAGKGHEDYQQIGMDFHHFDDREIIGNLLALDRHPQEKGKIRV